MVFQRNIIRSFTYSSLKPRLAWLYPSLTCLKPDLAWLYPGLTSLKPGPAWLYPGLTSLKPGLAECVTSYGFDCNFRTHKLQFLTPPLFVCNEDERVLQRQAAARACPYCGGMIQAVDLESQWRLCFVPLSFKKKKTWSRK
uniref:Uncharacterized protein LOC104217983 n=1 Tax=Nicotiana sylvestris TaxID=4096 RepID=A0A1U7VXE2_NICSY|nr:PREDICTED: uncharacterized protein LOC104217983 [Nicotiana sylvestris]